MVLSLIERTPAGPLIVGISAGLGLLSLGVAVVLRFTRRARTPQRGFMPQNFTP